MTKTMKMVSVVLMVILLTMTLSPVVMAAPTTETDASETTGSGKVTTVIDQMEKAHAKDTTGISNIGGQITDIITTVGIVVAVIVIVVLGIKYMIGSASEKAEYKKTMIPYLVGAALLLGGSSIVKLIFNAIQITSTTAG